MRKCSRCGRVTEQGFKEVWARELNNKPISIKLYRERCSKCGIINADNYSNKVTQMGLKPY